MWQEINTDVSITRIINVFDDDTEFEYSNESAMDVDTGAEVLELTPIGGDYSTSWVHVDLPKIADDLEAASVSTSISRSVVVGDFGDWDQYIFGGPNSSTIETSNLIVDVFGWEKVIVECTGVSNEGSIELWESHHYSSGGTEWTEWKKLSEIQNHLQVVYLTHLDADGDRYDGIQFRIRMKSEDGTGKCYNVDRLTLYPIVDANWGAYRYFEPQFPVIVEIGYDNNGGNFDLPILHQEDTPRFTFRIQQYIGEYVDITDASVYLRAKEKYLEGEYIFDKECIVIDAEFGLCEVELTSSDTAAYGEYLVELGVTYSDNRKLVMKTYPLTIKPKI